MILASRLVIATLFLPAWALAAGPFEIPLWPGVAPGSESSILKETVKDPPVTDGTNVKRDRHVLGVTEPTMTVYLPAVAKATGAAVVILPGGGFNVLAIDKEGHDVARWLTERGVAGIVVKYRLPDADAGVFVHNGSLPDVQRAIRLTRLNADKWKIDAQRIGVAGFSAGGYLTAAAGTMFDDGDHDAADRIARTSSRPNFISPIYPLVLLTETTRQKLVARMLGPAPTDELIRRFSPDRRVTAETPPTFLVHADDDRLSSEHSVAFYLALKRAKVPVELHVYSRGGHGYGMRQRGLPLSSWGDRWLDWMRAEGFLDH